MPRHNLSDFDKNLRKQISENLKKYSANMTQSELSALTGIPASTISGYFAMRSTPNAGNVQKLATALGVSKADIDPRFMPTTQSESVESNLTPKDLKEIAKDLEEMMNNISSNEFAAYGGVVESESDRELLYSAVKAAMEVAKFQAKKFSSIKSKKQGK